MSARLIIAVAMAGIAAFGAGAGTTWTLLQPRSAQSGAAVGGKPASLSERREHREKFFSGDAERNIRGGQEMKPRW